MESGELGYEAEESCADLYEWAPGGMRPAFLCSSMPNATEDRGGMLLYPQALSPELTANGLELKAITVGYRHWCALTETGQAVCEGRNERDQLGVANSPLRYRMLSAGED